MKFARGAAVALALAAGAGVLVGSPSRAADAPAAASAASPSAASPAGTDAGDEAGEPAVRRTHVEDGRTRIDELRVRGQLRRITVDPKGRAPSYEIITGDGSRDFSDGANTSRGAAGKRVWNVLRF